MASPTDSPRRSRMPLVYGIACVGLVLLALGYLTDHFAFMVVAVPLAPVAVVLAFMEMNQQAREGG